MWSHTVAGVVRPAWVQASQQGLRASCAARAACQRAVPYSALRAAWGTYARLTGAGCQGRLVDLGREGLGRK